ncbi:hypothetical protein DH2020_015113 [Rehmannia glutinosa]|uniref:Cation/H(+) antiporter central domain-containing protein n=1 Tax=Rehmannia glutinosa TaxID=99300 RepID=A0ABR0WZU2_REHGL
MHEDICHIAEKKRAALIILPFHKQWKREDDQVIEINLGQGWRGVNERVLTNAPCSIAVLVDRGFGLGLGLETGASNRDDPVKRICIPFLGGPDSREALQLGGRMADNPGMRITVIRFSISAGEIDEQNNNLFGISKDHREEQIGGLLASSQHGINSSILVIQQHDSAPNGHAARLKIVHGKDGSFGECEHL